MSGSTALKPARRAAVDPPALDRRDARRAWLPSRCRAGARPASPGPRRTTRWPSSAAGWSGGPSTRRPRSGLGLEDVDVADVVLAAYRGGRAGPGRRWRPTAAAGRRRRSGSRTGRSTGGRVIEAARRRRRLEQAARGRPGRPQSARSDGPEGGLGHYPAYGCPASRCFSGVGTRRRGAAAVGLTVTSSTLTERCAFAQAAVTPR